MRLAHHLTIRNGHLCINGQDCVALAEKYGTPLYVTSEDRVIELFKATGKLSVPATRRCRCSLQQKRTVTLPSCGRWQHRVQVRTSSHQENSSSP